METYIITVNGNNDLFIGTSNSSDGSIFMFQINSISEALVGEKNYLQEMIKRHKNNAFICTEATKNSKLSISKLTYTVE